MLQAQPNTSREPTGPSSLVVLTTIQRTTVNNDVYKSAKHHLKLFDSLVFHPGSQIPKSDVPSLTCLDCHHPHYHFSA